jgi:hypothetical protein
MTRLLKPAGKIILGVPFLYWIHEAPHDYYRYTKFALENFCQRNGLKVLYLEPYGGAPEVVIDIVSKLVVYSRRRTKYWAAIAGAYMNSAVGQRLSANTRLEFPLGYCLVAEK